MKIWRWTKTVLLMLWTVESLLLKLGWFVLMIGWSKFWAVQSYRRELRRAGLPSWAVQELVAAYDFSLSDGIRIVWGRRRWHRK